MILFHYLIKNDFSFIQKYLNKLFKYSPLFKEYLKKYHLDSNNIVFELSETTSIEDKHLFKQAVRHYRSQGFEIAIDDVGSGYSNLNRINHTQPEYIKLDKELIRDIHLNRDKRTMVEVMVNYCKATHYKLIVEGRT